MVKYIIIKIYGLKNIFRHEPIFMVYRTDLSAALADFNSEDAAQLYCNNEQIKDYKSNSNLLIKKQKKFNGNIKINKIEPIKERHDQTLEALKYYCNETVDVQMCYCTQSNKFSIISDCTNEIKRVVVESYIESKNSETLNDWNEINTVLDDKIKHPSTKNDIQ